MSEAILELGPTIYKIFITAIMSVVVVAIVGSILSSDLNTRDVQKELLVNKILYSPDGFWYKAHGTTYPGVLDTSTFTQTTMDAAFIYPENYGGAKITYVTSAGESNPIYVNKPTYDNFKGQATIGLSKGGHLQTYSYPVVVQQGEQRSNGYLIIEVAYPEKA
jgi:hypothetical protein